MRMSIKEFVKGIVSVAVVWAFTLLLTILLAILIVYFISNPSLFNTFFVCGLAVIPMIALYSANEVCKQFIKDFYKRSSVVQKLLCATVLLLLTIAGVFILYIIFFNK